MKKLGIIILTLSLMIGAFVVGHEIGHHNGINIAVTSDGFVDEDERGIWFVLDVNGQYYEWDISES